MLSKVNTNRVAIIGRPNVGKSTLFNILSGTKKAVVKNRPGVTRDIQIEPAQWLNKEFDIIDTGGVTEAEDVFSRMIKKKVLSILDSVDCLIVVADGKSGICPEDRDLIKIAKASEKPFCVLVNKVDDPSNEEYAKADFWEFGVEVYATSFEHRRGITEALEWVCTHFPDSSSTEREGFTITIVGKPNVGKSSLTNRLLGESRMLVSDIAGTTVDAIDSEIEFDGEKFILIDTAGLRRKSKRYDEVEQVASFKSEDSIRRAELVLLMVDVMQGPTVQDAKMLELIHKHHKAVLLVANKTDIAQEEREAFRKNFREQVANVFHFNVDIPVCFISAETGSGLHKLFETVSDMRRKLAVKIPTAELNRFFMRVIRKAPAPVYGHRNVKFYYLTQTSQKPPSFIAFANHPDGVNNAYRRFLIKRIKEEWGLEGIPIRIFAMKTGGKKSKKALDFIDDSHVEEQVLSFENELPEDWADKIDWTAKELKESPAENLD
ncbi:MAG: ribosome biogenesis GTPase Der [Bdellovibrionales bacterium]